MSDQNARATFLSALRAALADSTLSVSENIVLLNYGDSSLNP